MKWSTRFQSHPQFGQAVRFTTGRPPWVLKATALIAGIVFVIPMIAVIIVLIAGFAVTALAWIIFSSIARMIDAITGQGQSQDQPKPEESPAPGDDGRENVRVIHR